jgi:hypothetical protein
MCPRSIYVCAEIRKEVNTKNVLSSIPSTKKKKKKKKKKKTYIQQTGKSRRNR